MPKLLLASYNKGKLKELKALLKDLRVDLVTPEDLELFIDIAEDGNSYAENAAIKAQTFARETGLLTLADDSGLEVEAMDNAPGMYSARYNPKPGASDADRRQYLLERLHAHQRPWKARFRCTVAIAEPHGKVYFAEGICEGEVIPQERGTHGFGYDPIFFIPEMGMTTAELKMEDKNLISHRARAVRKAIPIISDLLGTLEINAMGQGEPTKREGSVKGHLVEISWKSRKKLARELHDGPVQAVAALAMRASIIRRLVERPSESLDAELDNIEELARRTTREMRYLLFRMYPVVLESQNLEVALKDLVDKIQETFSQRVWLSLDLDVINELGEALQALIFDISVEAINNARKHAQPANIWVRLNRGSDDTVLVEIEDDGLGFDVSKVNERYPNREKLGLSIVRAWVELFQGDLDIVSSPGKGTMIQARIPLNPATVEDLTHET